MSTVTRSRTFHCGWDADVPAGMDKGRHVIEPGFLVKVCDKEPAGFILKQGIDTDGMPALEMVKEDLIIEWKKCLIRALAAFHPGLFADATYPFIAAGRRIPFPAGLRTYPEQRKDIIPTPEQFAKQRDLSLCGGRYISAGLYCRGGRNNRH